MKRVDTTVATGGVAYSLSYAYDAVGNRVLMVDGENHRTTYSNVPAAASYTIDVVGPYEVRSRVRFDSQGSVYERQLKNTQASEEITALDLSGWRTSANYTQPSGQTTNFADNKDKAGNRLRVWEQSNTTAWTYTYYGYDGVNQLTSEYRADVPGYANTYTYDPAGNRTTRNSLGVETIYNYGPGNQLVSEWTDTENILYDYNQNGDLAAIRTSSGDFLYWWDSNSRLIKVDSPGNITERLTYSADGLRRSKTVTPAVGSPVTTHYVYDGQTLVQERDENGLILVQNTWGPDSWNMDTGSGWDAGNIGDTVLLQRKAITPGNLAGGTSSYFGSDLNYNNRLIFDGSGNVTDRISYEAFGELFGRTGSTVTSFLFGGGLGYYQDAVRRLNVGRRVYDPVMGRWTSLDPIGFDGGDWNLYRYVENNPINQVDPSGLQSCVGYDNVFKYMEKEVPFLQPDPPGPHFSGCDSSSAGRRVISTVNNICSGLEQNYIKPAFIANVNRCYQKGRPCVGRGPTQFNTALLKQYVDVCSAASFTCNTCSPGTCGERVPWPTGCRINVCANNLVAGGCGGYGGIDSFYGTLLHEMSHCAYFWHRLKPTPYDCIDIISCCIVQAIFPKRGRPACHNKRPRRKRR